MSRSDSDEDGVGVHRDEELGSDGDADRTRLLFGLEGYRSVDGYGWSATMLVNGKHRLRWSSRKATTRKWPTLTRGTDENCNRAITVVLWPLGHLDVWWEPRWRPAGSGLCEPCRSELLS